MNEFYKINKILDCRKIKGGGYDDEEWGGYDVEGIFVKCFWV